LPLVDQGGKASRDSVFLRSSDRRLMTVCGIKTDSVIRTNGADGVLLYGPYIEIAPGIYRVRVYGECNWGSNGAAAKLEVVANGGRWSLGDCDLRGVVRGDRVDGLLGRLDFTVPQAVPDLEVRIVVSGETEMVIESLDIVALAQSALDA